ncbi:MAG: hypothetical protein ACRD1Q_06895 [Vicinamibacterales bacterium]
MDWFAKPTVAIAFGAFMLCAETCLHAETLSSFPARPLELPLYDWIAAGFLVSAGVLSLRHPTTWHRQFQAVAWAFMLSLLTGAFISQLDEWLRPPDIADWGLSEGAFVAIILGLILIALCGLGSSLKPRDS